MPNSSSMHNILHFSTLHYRYGCTELIKGGCHEIARTGLIFPPRQLFGLETIAHRAEPIAVDVNYMVLSNV